MLENLDLTKFFSISIDNASNNTVTINLLKNHLRPILNGKFFHIRYVCHIINLYIHDGLKYLDTYIHKLRSTILFIRSYSKEAKL